MTPRSKIDDLIAARLPDDLRPTPVLRWAGDETECDDSPIVDERLLADLEWLERRQNDQESRARLEESLNRCAAAWNELVAQHQQLVEYREQLLAWRQHAGDSLAQRQQRLDQQKAAIREVARRLEAVWRAVAPGGEAPALERLLGEIRQRIADGCYPPGEVVLWIADGLAAYAAGDPVGKHLEQKAPTVVVLKLVLKVGEYENAAERVATVVDPAGVIMTTGLGSSRGGTKVAIESARVVFPGDEKEYDAVLGAFDSRLGLSFFRIKDLGGKKIASVNLDDVVEPKVGDELFGVSRLEE
ncbi:MAG: hypothetical protein HUU22_12435, partial [Phycisphaerae bacterium]|nr:hypothetical protein [Phycisphaerae bacterium]